ncbi:Aldehyde dehydrogenase family protein [Candida parapsilosis]|uniref:Aldehyde dehydrogenase family protein n=1 Tax=Candida parapsilosis TaxID=5480 RepID=A0A8X7NHQ8_CANPA|nr:Aldehyde dehydrogenase family protein [Candida parapsilosis]KAF6042862.1 Aldehyde dehydrogenase family protein [Candida parapsilosis]
MSKSTKNSKANPGSSANANASAKPAVSQVIGDTKPSKSVKTAGTNGTTKANPIPPPQLDHVEGLSSPESSAASPKSSKGEEPSLEHRISIKRSSQESTLNDIASGKSNVSGQSSSTQATKVGSASETKSSTATTTNDGFEYKYTELSEIPIGVKKVTDGFFSGKTHSLQFRLNQLRNLYFAIKDHQQEICDALELDFARNSSETKNYEIATGLNELLFTMTQLHKWAKPEKVTDLPVNLLTNPVYIERIPLGVVLVMSAFNYPLFVSISPIVGAIAAGNTVVFKPSELTPRFSKLFVQLLTEALDPDIFYAVNGAIPETTEVLNQKFDKIVYTGNGMVGRIVAKKAAENLTPVVLELGGKSPAIILDDIKDKDLATAARRIAWGRFANAGQTCIGVDYVLIAESKRAKFVAEIKKVIEKELYPGVNKNDKNFTHMIHDRAFNRMVKIIKETKGSIVTGGEYDAQTKYVAPTIIDDVSWSDASMEGEIFGPILPILTYSNINEACKEIIRHHDTPLAAYIFTGGYTSAGKNPQVANVKKSIRSGGLIVNDVLMHIALHNAPFGGVGESGYGSYHGKFSYRTFTHERTVIEQPLNNDWMLQARYPPFSDAKDRLMSAGMAPYGGRVWFGEQGNVRVDGPSAFFKTWTTAVGLVGLVGELISSKL